LIRSSQNIHQKNHKIEKFHRCAVCVILKFGPAYREKWRCESYITDHPGLTSPKNHRNKKINQFTFYYHKEKKYKKKKIKSFHQQPQKKADIVF